MAPVMASAPASPGAETSSSSPASSPALCSTARADGGERRLQALAPALDAERVEHHLAHRRVGDGLGDDVDRRARGMRRPLDEGQAGDDLRAALARRAPSTTRPAARPGSARNTPRSPAEPATASITARGAVVRHVGHREAEMEARRVAHRRVAAGDVGMHAVGRLDIGEGRDDDAPDALGRVEGQQALMPRGEAAHHRRPRGRGGRRSRNPASS